jgi:2-methylisocitrate lyase-like PEP mutase family enzyme
MREDTPGSKLRALMGRPERVLAMLHPPTAALARIMEQAGCEAGFVGTGSVVGAITGYADVGTLSMLECVQVARWIAQSVDYPVMVDGDTGHGGIMAVRRLVRECIHAGLAGVRIDDQPIESKRRTQTSGMEVVSLAQAVARYRAAADMRDELDPSFVIMAQCYARDAVNSSLDDTLLRLKAYAEVGGADWVQLESPHSIDEIKQARACVRGPFSFMKGKLERFLTAEEHLQLGTNLAWYPSFTHQVIWAALSDFMKEFNAHGIQAWEAFQRERASRPYLEPKVGAGGEGAALQAELEQRYGQLDLASYR